MKSGRAFIHGGWCPHKESCMDTRTQTEHHLKMQRLDGTCTSQGTPEMGSKPPKARKTGDGSFLTALQRTTPATTLTFDFYLSVNIWG